MSNAETQIILNELKAIKEELKNTIIASEARLLLKIEDLNNKISYLETENRELKDKLEYLERDSKQNNIIIFGLKENPREINCEFICNKLKELLDVDINEIDINSYNCLGKNNNCPLKVQFVSRIKKQLVLNSTKKLKGQSVAISQDLTNKQRNELRILRKHLAIARDQGKKSFIRTNKLMIEGQIYTAEDLEDYEDTSSERRGNSLPTTPTQELIRAASPELVLHPAVSIPQARISAAGAVPKTRYVLKSMQLRSNSTSSASNNKAVRKFK